MDLQFSSKLQTAIMNLGRVNGFAPPKSQDPVNEVLHEYFVAETARSIFDKRKKAALEQLKSLDAKGVAAAAVKQAAKIKIGSSNILFDTADYNCMLTVKTPAEKFDKIALKNELVRLGVDEVTINKAFDAATTHNKPAETYTVNVKVT